MTTPTPTQLYVGFSRGDSWLSRLIIKLTGLWSHCFLFFAAPEAIESIDAWYYESNFGKGVEGPKPWQKLVDWAKRGKTRRWELIQVYGDLEWIAAVEERARGMVGRKGYGELQIAWLWAKIRFGRKVPPSPDQVICSEFVARCLAPELDIRDPQHPTFEEVTPGSIYKRLMQRQESRGSNAR